MTALTDAYERLQKHVDELPPSVRDPLMVVLEARCGTCRRWKIEVMDLAECTLPGDQRLTPRQYGCTAWERREETT